MSNIATCSYQTPVQNQSKSLNQILHGTKIFILLYIIYHCIRVRKSLNHDKYRPQSKMKCACLWNSCVKTEAYKSENRSVGQATPRSKLKSLCKYIISSNTSASKRK